MKKGLWVVSIVTVLVAGFIWSPPPAQAQSPITLGKTVFDYDFPNKIEFEVRASSSAGEIVEAELFFSPMDYLSWIRWDSEELNFQAGTKVTLKYTWRTRFTVPPNMPVVYYWRVVDSAGNEYESEREITYFSDDRFDWSMVENDLVAVWWHDKSDAFGGEVFRVATEAIESQQALFQVELDYQIQVIINNDFEEFEEWHAFTLEWVGGQAFTSYGITTQIVYGNVIDTVWVREVVPHEISHLYFAKAVANPSITVPTWLDEGVAQYNEITNYQRSLLEAKAAAKNEELIPLRFLNNSFVSHEEKDNARLAYSESLSAVLYMVEAYGEDAIADLLAGFRNRLSTEDAIYEAFGVTMEQFEADWAAWLGAPEGSYIVPTQWGLPTFPASPTYVVPGALSTETTPEPEFGTDETPQPVAQEDPDQTEGNLQNEDGQVASARKLSTVGYVALGVIAYMIFSLVTFGLIWRYVRK